MIARTLSLTAYNHSLFLFGPRQTGKTFLIKHTLKPDLYIDLLKQKEFFRYAKDVSLLSDEVGAIRKDDPLVVIDEIQRLPELLNEVHSLIEELRGSQFVLTGSSARKLRRGGVNLLGGRALTLHLFPLTHEELGDKFVLKDALQYGTLPKIAMELDILNKSRFLKTYVETYLKEEIQQEALTRNVPAFARFLELAAFENGNIINYSNISREVGVYSNTIKEYFQILQDTLIGFFLHPYTRSHRAKLVAHPKFFFFDTGIVTTLKNQLSMELVPSSPPFGNAFEHWCLVELKRLLDYRERAANLSFFRTTDGAEVDIIIEFQDKIWAVEIKSGTAPKSSDVRGLKSFIEDHKYQRALCVCQTPRTYKIGNIEFIPWQKFFEEI